MIQYPMYEDEMVRLVHSYLPHMTHEDIRRAVQYSMQKRYKETKCKIDNNYTKTQTTSTLLEMANWINEREPICTAYGVMFKKHNLKKPNPLTELVRSFMEGRDVYKKQMFEYLEAHDYTNVSKYNLLQLLSKRDANSIYGCLGNAACVLYNLYVAASITAQGRSVISTATMFFESFLANNVKFASLEEVLHFIDCVKSERKDRRFNDSVILDFPVSVDMCFAKIIRTCCDWRKGKIKWVPDIEDAKIIYRVLKNSSQEDINRIFYKNNLYSFIDNSVIINAIRYILKLLKEPFLTPNKIPEEIQVELDALQDLMREYVYYPHMYIDRIDRCDNMIKDVCVISDTDSTIVSFDAFYHYVLDRVYMEDISILNMELDTRTEEIYDVPRIERRYDFFTDEVVERESNIKPFILIPQNNLRFSIINIIAYISGNLCNEYIELYTKHNHSWSPERKCLLYLKNEFLFSRALLTPNKKNYATNQELKEGVILEQDIKHSLDIKGLPINKSTLNDSAKAALQKILYEDILVTDHIDPTLIIEKIAILEKDIEKSLRSGEKKYFKPLSIKAYSSYEDPMRIQGIKASLVWNKVRDPQLEAIDLDARNTIGVVKVQIDPSNIDRIRDKYPDVYDRFVELFMDQTFFKPDISEDCSPKKKEITTLAIPIDVDTPEWVSEFIDYKTIVNDNIGNFPVESVGIRRLGASNINYSTIMNI